MRAILLFYSIIFYAISAFAHGDDNHDHKPATKENIQEYRFVSETENFSVVLVYPAARGPQKATLLIAKFASSEPVENAKVILDLKGAVSSSILFTPTSPGVYQAPLVALPASGVQGVVTIQTQADFDITPLGGLSWGPNLAEPAKLQNPSNEKKNWVLYSVILAIISTGSLSVGIFLGKFYSRERAS